MFAALLILTLTAPAQAAPSSAQANPDFQEGLALFNAKKYPDAVVALRKAQQSFAADPYLNVKLCHALERAGDLKGAVVQCRAAVAMTPLTELNKAEAHGTLGNALIKTGYMDEGVKEYRLCLESDPTAELRSNLGFILDKLKRYDEAEVECRQATVYHPADELAFRCLGMALFKRGRTSEAIAAQRQALKLKPDYFFAENDLGDSLAAQGRGDEAMALYRSAIAHGSHAAHYGLGKLLAKRGEAAPAAQELSLFVKLQEKDYYSRDEVAEAKRLLASLNAKT